MATEYNAGDDGMELPQAAFQPSAGLRTRLLWGCVASLVVGMLSAAIVQLSVPDPEGVTLSDVLDLVTCVPLAVMLWALLGLAKEVGSFGLRCTSIGTYGAMMLIALLPLAEARVTNETVAIIAIVALIVLTLGILGAMMYRPAWAVKAASGDGTAKASWGGAGGFAFLLFMLIKYLVRGRGLANLGMEEMGLLFGAALLLIMVLATLIGGIIKLRLRNRLGVASTALGLVEILIPLVISGVIGTFIFALVDALAQAGPNLVDEEAVVNDLTEAWSPTLNAVAVGVSGVWSIMTVLFMWSVRGNADPDLLPEL